jgi:hypothetical protein
MKGLKMKHVIEESTRKAVREVITMIRQKHNISRDKAEELFRRSLSESDVIDTLLDHVDNDLEDQRFMACGGV